MTDDSAVILFQSFLQEAVVSSSGIRRDVSCHPAFSLPTTASLHQGALKAGFGEACMVYDMPEPYKFVSFDSCQKRFAWAHKEVALAPHPLVGLVLLVCKGVSSGTNFESLDLFSQSQQAGSMYHSHIGGWR